MTLLAACDTEKALTDRLTGGAALMVPENGTIAEVSPEEYEERARCLAYGLMVKGCRRGSSVSVNGCNDKLYTFVNAGCRLARLSATHAETAGETSLDASPQSLEYLIMLGRTWSAKYKPSVDRVIRELMD